MLPTITHEETGWRKSLAAYRAVFVEPEDYSCYRKIPVKVRETAEYVASQIIPYINIHDIYDMAKAIEFGSIVEEITFDGRDVMRIIEALGKSGICDIDGIRCLRGNPRDIFGIGEKYSLMVLAAQKMLEREPVRNSRLNSMITAKCLERLDMMADAEHMCRSAFLEQLIDHEWYTTTVQY